MEVNWEYKPENQEHHTKLLVITTINDYVVLEVLYDNINEEQKIKSYPVFQGAKLEQILDEHCKEIVDKGINVAILKHNKNIYINKEHEEILRSHKQNKSEI
jgi:hypothetical protein